MRLKESPSQTAGPYVHIGLVPSVAGLGDVYGRDLGSGPLYGEGARGERITITGRVLDGTGAPLRDVVVEIWQADADGLYPAPNEPRGDADPNMRGWGRSAADGEGVFRFETIRPGSVPFPDGRAQAPHVSLWIVARGINLGLSTRLYFPEDAAAHAADPLMTRIDPPGRRATLVVERVGHGTYHHDVRLQGERETVFLDV